VKAGVSALDSLHCTSPRLAAPDAVIPAKAGTQAIKPAEPSSSFQRKLEPILIFRRVGKAQAEDGFQFSLE